MPSTNFNTLNNDQNLKDIILNTLGIPNCEGSKRTGLYWTSPFSGWAECDCYDDVFVPISVLKNITRSVGRKFVPMVVPQISKYLQPFRLAKLDNKLFDLRKLLAENRNVLAIYAEDVANILKKLRPFKSQMEEYFRQYSYYGQLAKKLKDEYPKRIARLDAKIKQADSLCGDNILDACNDYNRLISNKKDYVAASKSQIKMWETEYRKYFDAYKRVEQTAAPLENEYFAARIKKQTFVENSINPIKRNIKNIEVDRQLLVKNSDYGSVIDNKYLDIGIFSNTTTFEFILQVLTAISLVEKRICGESNWPSGVKGVLTPTVLNEDTCQCECPENTNTCEREPYSKLWLDLPPFFRTGDELWYCINCCGGKELKTSGFFRKTCTCECPNDTIEKFCSAPYSECGDDAPGAGGFICAPLPPDGLPEQSIFGQITKFKWDSDECKWVCKNNDSLQSQTYGTLTDFTCVEPCEADKDCPYNKYCCGGECSVFPCKTGAWCVRTKKCNKFYITDCKEGTFNNWINDDNNELAENFNEAKSCEEVVCTIENVPACCDNSECGPCEACVDNNCVSYCETNECCINNSVCVENGNIGCPCSGNEDCGEGSKCCNGICEVTNSCACSDDSDCYDGATCCYGTCCDASIGQSCCDDTQTCGFGSCCSNNNDCDNANCFICSEEVGRCINACGEDKVCCGGKCCEENQGCCKGECQDLIGGVDSPFSEFAQASRCCNPNATGLGEIAQCGECETCVPLPGNDTLGWCVSDCAYFIVSYLNDGKPTVTSIKPDCNNYCEDNICKNDCDCNETCEMFMGCVVSTPDALEVCCENDTDCGDCEECFSLDATTKFCISSLEDGEVCCGGEKCYVSVDSGNINCTECIETDGGVFSCISKCLESETCCDGNCCIEGQFCCDGKCLNEPCCQNDNDCPNSPNNVCCNGECIDHECCSASKIWSPCKNECVECSFNAIWSEEKCKCECQDTEPCFLPNRSRNVETCACECDPINIEEICTDKNLAFNSNKCGCDCDSENIIITQDKCPGTGEPLSPYLWDDQTCTCKCNEKYQECGSPYVFGPDCQCVCPQEIDSWLQAGRDTPLPGSPGAKLPDCPDEDGKKGIWDSFNCECIYPCSTGTPYSCFYAGDTYINCADCGEDEYLASCGENTLGFNGDIGDPRFRVCKKKKWYCINNECVQMSPDDSEVSELTEHDNKEDCDIACGVDTDLISGTLSGECPGGDFPCDFSYSVDGNSATISCSAYGVSLYWDGSSWSVISAPCGPHDILSSSFDPETKTMSAYMYDNGCTCNWSVTVP